MFYLIPIRKEQYLNNLKIAFPEESDGWYNDLAKNGYHFFMDRFVQFFSFPNSFSDLEINVKNREILNDALKLKKGVIFVSGHFGAWEILSAWLSSKGYPITAVASKQKNRGSNQFFIEHRGQFGMKHVYRRSSLDNMYQILDRGEILALISDQDARKRGVFVNFFNKRSSTPKGAAQFHLNCDSPIIFTVCYLDELNQNTIEFIPIEINKGETIEMITQKYTSVLENFVRKYPEQYFWFHRRWKTQPPK
jgi:KDO2-lipid IV(A) lauroyltransferase